MKRWRRISVPSWVPVAMTVGVLVAQVGIATAPPRPVHVVTVGGPARLVWISQEPSPWTRTVTSATPHDSRSPRRSPATTATASTGGPDRSVLARASRDLTRPPFAERSRWSTQTAQRARSHASSSSRAGGISTPASSSLRPRTVSGGLALARSLPEPWRSIVRCESLGDESWRVSAASRARGFFQFMPSTWRSLGMSGDPAEAPFSVQYAAARKLRARDGLGAWDCARILGWA